MPTEGAGFEERVGQHIFRFEPPDLFVVHFIGDFSAEAMEGLAECFKRAPGKFYVIIFANELGNISMGARKAVAGLPMASGLAFISVMRHMQVVISLMNKIYIMVNRGKDSPMTFVSSEAEARRWVEHLRAGEA